MRKGVIFNNKKIFKPGAYGTIDAQGMVGKTYDDQRIMVIVGTSEGGEPGKLHWFSDPRLAMDTLKGGDLHKAVEMAWNPTKTGGGGAGTIGVIRVGNPTKSELALGTFGKIVSKDYGKWVNSLKAKVEDGTIDGTKSLTIYNSLTDEYSVARNLGAILKLSGTASYVSATISEVSGVKSLELKSGVDEPTSTVLAKIDLADPRYSRMRRLVEFINSFDGVTAEPVEGLSPEVMASDLDAGTFLKEGYLTAFVKDLETKLAENNWVDVEVTDASATLDNFDYTSLTGGSNGDVDSSWVKYFDMLGSAQISVLVPLSEEPSIIAEALSHCDYMSDEKAKERICICGLGLGNTVKAVSDFAQVLNHPRAQVVYPGAYVPSNGSLELRAPYLLAAMVAGRTTFIPVGESNTFKYFNISKLERSLEPSEIDTLIQNGVACFEEVTGSGVRMVYDLTSYTDSEESLYTERSVVMLADAINKELREKLEDLQVGKKGLLTTAETLKNATISFLKEKIKKEEITSYRNVTVTYYNKRADVEYEVAPVEPTNFIFIKGHFYTEDSVTN